MKNLKKVTEDPLVQCGSKALERNCDSLHILLVTIRYQPIKIAPIARSPRSPLSPFLLRVSCTELRFTLV